MSDIVARLRTHQGWPVDAHHDALEAADEIERLRTDHSALLSAFNAKLDAMHEEIMIVHERIRKLGI